MTLKNILHFCGYDGACNNVCHNFIPYVCKYLLYFYVNIYAYYIDYSHYYYKSSGLNLVPKYD